MSKIYIGFSITSGFISWLIRKASRTSFSHTFSMFHSTIFDRDMVCHAARSFVHFVNFNKFQKRSKVVEIFEINVSSDERVKIMQYCFDKAGTKYGFTTLIGIGLVILLEKFGIRVPNPFGDRANSYICSEMVNDICNIVIQNLPERSRKLFPKLDAEQKGMAAIRDRVKLLSEVKNGEYFKDNQGT